MTSKILLLHAFLTFTLASCFNPSSGVSAASASNLGNKIVEEGQNTKLGISEGSLAGTEIEISAGTLAVGSSVSVDLTTTPSAFEGHKGVSQASEALSVTATDGNGSPITSLETAMTLKLPLSDAETALALFDVEKTEENLCIFLDSDDESFYVWRRSAFTISANFIVFESTRFGVYQLYYCGEETVDESKDAATEGIAGSFNSSGDGGSGTTTVADTTPPAKPTMVDDKERNDSSSVSPTITWGAVADSDLDHYEVAIGTIPGTNDVADWLDVGNVVSFSFSSLSLTDGLMYYASVVAVDKDGNKSSKANGDGWQQLSCPSNYVKVEGNTTVGLGGSVYSAGTKSVYDWATNDGSTMLNTRKISDFCVMKYEARDDSGAASADPSIALFTGQNRATSETKCTDIGTNYHLMQNNFWQAVAREAENVDENWVANTPTDDTGSNYFYHGHIDESPNSACSDTGNETINSTCTTSGGNEQDNRALTLKSGEKIWDLSGNLEEWVRDHSISETRTDDAKDWITTFKLNYGPEINHSGKSAARGLGIAFTNASHTYFTRGGNYSTTGTEDGVFTITSVGTSDGSSGNRGFRCIYAP